MHALPKVSKEGTAPGEKKANQALDVDNFQGAPCSDGSNTALKEKTVGLARCKQDCEHQPCEEGWNKYCKQQVCKAGSLKIHFSPSVYVKLLTRKMQHRSPYQKWPSKDPQGMR